MLYIRGNIYVYIIYNICINSIIYKECYNVSSSMLILLLMSLPTYFVQKKTRIIARSSLYELSSSLIKTIEEVLWSNKILCSTIGKTISCQDREKNKWIMKYKFVYNSTVYSYNSRGSFVKSLTLFRLLTLFITTTQFATGKLCYCYEKSWWSLGLVENLERRFNH